MISRQRTVSAIAMLASTLAIVACSDGASSIGTEPVRAGAPIGRHADAIQGGAADTSNTFAVAVLDDKMGICSGTLIAPNLVLTARHCVADDSGGDAVNCARDKFSPPHAASTLRVSFDADAAFDTAAFRATKIIVPTEAAFCGNDLALIVLDKVVPPSVARPATPAINPPLTSAKYGNKLTAIGYGITAPGANDDGLRRTRNAIPITCIPGDATIGCNVADFDMTTAELAAGNGLCEGDSGSGAYAPATLGTNAPIVFGVLSRAADISGQCADSIYGRTDTASAFLIAGAKDAAMIGGYAPPAWTTPGAMTTPGADAGPIGEDDAGTDQPAGTSGAPAAPPSSGGPTTTTTGCTIVRASSTADRSTVDTSTGLAAMLGIAFVAAARRRRRRHRV